MELNPIQAQHFLQKMPEFKPSYETSAPEHIDEEYNIGLAIPLGKKIYIWFTFDLDKDVCCMIDINRNKRVSTTRVLCNHTLLDLSIGTILYGTYIEDDTEQPYIISRRYTLL